MQVETHAPHPDEIASSLSRVLSETRAQEVAGLHRGAMQGITTPAFTFATSDVGIQAVDEWLVCLVEAHETTVRAVPVAHRCAEKALDFQTCSLLERRTDVHEAAVCELGSLYLASRVSCEGGCAQSAEARKLRLRSTFASKPRGIPPAF
jgi:hypothetical protein